MLKFQVSSSARDEQASTIANSRSTNKATTRNRGVNHGNVLAEFRFKDGVKVFRATDTYEMSDGTRVS